MFTGLIREMAGVLSLARKSTGAELALKTPALSKAAAVGDSISVNGACLTVTSIAGDTLRFDLSGETLKSTNLGELRTGERVNLEPALRASDALGGHLVTGHVDGVGRIRAKRKSGEMTEIVIEAPAGVLRYLVDKGSVAVDGISLTVVDVMPDAFSVVIIPHTAANTSIGFKEASASVNLEADIIGKYVAKFLGRAGGGSSLKKSLIESGFMGE